MAQETFLILGASSFYGSNFAALVEERGDVAIRLSRPQWNLGDDIPSGCDYIVNFASRSLVAESWLDPQGWMMTNAVLTTALIQQAAGMKIKRFVHVSTPEVYGSRADPIPEGDQRFNPSTPYAVSRAVADMMVLAYHRAYGLPAIITRTANIYGPGQSEHRFIPLAFKTLRAGEKLLLDGAGETRRGWIHVRDACEATYIACRNGREGCTYHIAPRVVHSVEEVAFNICFVLSEGARRADGLCYWLDLLGSRGDRFGKDLCYWLDSSNMRSFAWCDRINLTKGLEEYGKATQPSGQVPARQA